MMSDRVEIEDGVSQCCVKVGRLRGITAAYSRKQ